MAEWLYNTGIVQSILARRRRERAAFVLSKVHVSQGMSILDVGCGPDGRSFESFVPGEFRIVGVDILDEKSVRMSHAGFKYIRQSAHDLSVFGDGEFDLAVSFGMMEHICDCALLGKMYSEIDRVARQWAIVVPWKYAFIEPHFKVPFFQLLPYSLKVLLTRTLNLHNLGHVVREDHNYIKEHYQWLTSRQWAEIFRGGRCCVTPHLDMLAVVKSDYTAAT